MKRNEAYPIILRPTEKGYYVIIPDFDTGTQGGTVAEAIEMAKDAIDLMMVDYEDDGKIIPSPGSIKAEVEAGDITTFVDVNCGIYPEK